MIGYIIVFEQDYQTEKNTGTVRHQYWHQANIKFNLRLDINYSLKKRVLLYCHPRKNLRSNEIIYSSSDMCKWA